MPGLNFHAFFDCSRDVAMATKSVVSLQNRHFQPSFIALAFLNECWIATPDFRRSQGNVSSTLCRNLVRFSPITYLPPWLSGLMLSELQCGEPGWLVRQGVGSPPAATGMSSQVSACYEIKFSGMEK